MMFQKLHYNHDFLKIHINNLSYDLKATEIFESKLIFVSETFRFFFNVFEVAKVINTFCHFNFDVHLQLFEAFHLLEK